MAAEVEIEKVLLDDIVLLPEGYIFTGKYYNTPRWLTQDHGTASFYIECLENYIKMLEEKLKDIECGDCGKNMLECKCDLTDDVDKG